MAKAYRGFGVTMTINNSMSYVSMRQDKMNYAIAMTKKMKHTVLHMQFYVYISSTRCARLVYDTRGDDYDNYL
jgi:hypothetical protein